MAVDGRNENAGNSTGNNSEQLVDQDVLQTDIHRGKRKIQPNKRGSLRKKQQQGDGNATDPNAFSKKLIISLPRLSQSHFNKVKFWIFAVNTCNKKYLEELDMYIYWVLYYSSCTKALFNLKVFVLFSSEIQPWR